MAVEDRMPIFPQRYYYRSPRRFACQCGHHNGAAH